MKARTAIRPYRAVRTKGRAAGWAPFLRGRTVGRKKAWECTFCGVIGSHRRGCHCVTETHHRPPKRIRRGMLGARARASRGTKASA